MTEATLTARLLRQVQRLAPDTVIFKHNDRTTAGIPDASLTRHGRTIWVEVKVEDREVTPAQRLTLRRLYPRSYVVRRRGGRWTVANGHDEDVYLTGLTDGDLAQYLVGLLG